MKIFSKITITIICTFFTLIFMIIILKLIMIIVTKVEPEYALRNQLIGIRLNLENRGIEEKRAEILVYISEKSQRVANNIFDKRDSLNTLTTEVINADKPASVYIPLKNGILVDRGVISYTIEIKQL
jgi:hypothetical protein